MAAANSLWSRATWDLDVGSVPVDVLNSSVAATPTVFGLVINNSENTVAIYLHMWNAASGSVSVGTTEANVIFRVPAGGVVGFAPNGGIGLAFGTACSVACLTASKGSAGPVSDVKVTVYTN